MQGWSLWVSSTRADIHVMREDDSRPHEFVRTCWCLPEVDDENVVTHNSLDGRERYEGLPLQ